MVTQTGQATAARHDEVRLLASGTTDIDDSANTETTAFILLTIAALAGAPINDARLVFDLDLATTGYGVVETAATIQFQIARQVDGTNWKYSDFSPLTALSGTLAATNRSHEIAIGQIAGGETVRIYAVMSADATADMEIPFKLYGASRAKPVMTLVAA
jgi:hypothetical protein